MRLALVPLLVAAACGQTATGGAPTSTTPNQATMGTATPSPTPVPIDMGDMMGGGIPDATVFTASGGNIHAVTLLNHFVRYRIPVSGRPHIAVTPSGALFYVADELDGGTRIRLFDVTTGGEFASTRVPQPPAGEAALAMDGAGGMFLLATEGTGVTVKRIQPSPLVALDDVLKSECGDRLHASAVRIAVVCEATGTVAIHALRAGPGPSPAATVTVPGEAIVGSAMLADGTLVLGSTDGAIYIVPPGSNEPSATVRSRGSVYEDGIAAAGPSTFVVFTAAGVKAAADVYDQTGAPVEGPFELAVRGPGVVALWPYAYFSGERGIWHVDLRSGLLERMLTLDDPVPLAVSSR